MSLNQARCAFPAEMEQEEAEEDRQKTFDCIADDEGVGDDVDEALLQEREMLEEMPLPGRSQRSNQEAGMVEVAETGKGGDKDIA